MTLDVAPKSYGVIYADPPWLFRNYSEKGTGRNAIAHYDCMPLEQLKSLPVGDLAAKGSVLFMWAVDPLLDKPIELIRTWGFEYKTVAFYWVKTNKTAVMNSLAVDYDFFVGLGYWTRANVEQCLLTTRGKPSRLGKDVCKLTIEPRREHSRKPDQVYGRIERLTRGPCLALFARQKRPGWHS